MVTITDEVIQLLENHNFFIPIKDVREPYSTKDPVYPMIVVEEVVNKPTLQIHAKELLSRIDYRFDIYARDTSHEGIVYTKRDIVSKIGNELDELIRATYGMKRVNSPMILPYGADGSIIRYIITYSGIIDNKTMIIYQ